MEQMINLKKINNFREKFSSHSDIFESDKYLNNTKIININNFNLKITNKKIKYSTYYTNPFVLDKKITNIISLVLGKNNPYQINLIDDILINKAPIVETNKIYLEKILIKKNNFISIEETFLFMIYLINYDNNILESDKEYYFNLLSYYWVKFKLKIFDIDEITSQFVNLDIELTNNQNDNQNIKLTCKIKFHISFYLLLEEFHYKYIVVWLKKNKTDLNNKKIILNSNYVKINPQEILNNYDGIYYANIPNILEQIQIPLGHNFLLIFGSNKVYYYDSDQNDFYDIFKLKKILDQINFKFTNISNRNPIQMITDDTNCLFYCLRFVYYMQLFNLQFSQQNLKTFVLIYEKNILNSNDMYDWINKIV